MNHAENVSAPAPSDSEYILDNFEVTDRIAMLVLNRDFGETIQRITSAKKASNLEFQGWGFGDNLATVCTKMQQPK